MEQVVNLYPSITDRRRFLSAIPRSQFLRAIPHANAQFSIISTNCRTIIAPRTCARYSDRQKNSGLNFLCVA